MDDWWQGSTRRLCHTKSTWGASTKLGAALRTQFFHWHKLWTPIMKFGRRHKLIPLAASPWHIKNISVCCEIGATACARSKSWRVLITKAFSNAVCTMQAAIVMSSTKLLLNRKRPYLLLLFPGLTLKQHDWFSIDESFGALSVCRQQTSTLNSVRQMLTF